LHIKLPQYFFNRENPVRNRISLFSSSCVAGGFVLLKIRGKEDEEGVMMHILSQHPLIDSLEISDDAFTEISRVLNMRRNFSISMYKDKCMKRRIAIRMRTCRCLDVGEYCRLLLQSEEELDLLQKALTIHVSQFFRNPSMFAKLQTDILPDLFLQSAAIRKKFRVYSLGCAGGEEAYTVAIILREFYSRQLLNTPVEISAYDIDGDILHTAARAEYTEDRLKDIPGSLRERYFVPKGQRMELTAEIRDMVSFHRHNIMEVETLEPCRLVLCRNTLIYFTRLDQAKILRGIAAILPTGGILVLGKSETVAGEVRHLFTNLCPVERIYRRV
jgi:chemotaxis protein methyltransferase CheR